MSIKEDLIGEQFVKGNLKDFLQSYNIFYYPPEENFPTSKVWIYLHGKEKEKPRMIRSLCFDNIEVHRRFILNNLLYHIHWLEKEGGKFKPEWMPISEYRKRLMDGVFIDLRKKLLKKLEEKSKIMLTSVYQPR